MATTTAKAKKTSPVFYIVGALVVGGLYFYFSGDDTPTPTKAVAAPKSASSSTADAYTDADYKASYPELKIVAKNAFMPLVRKAPAANVDGKQALPDTITGGGSWSYDGMVVVDNHTQGLLDEEKSGESDYVSVGEHWKHGRIRRITESAIDIVGDDGTSATMKMGEPSQTAPKEAAPAVAPLAVPDMTGQIGQMDVSPLPNANGFNGNGNGNGNGGWGGRRGGRNRGGGGRGFGGFGGGG
jgi:hypothetical protein